MFIIIVLLVLVTIFLGHSNAADNMDKAIYDSMLKKYVLDGTVDYLKWKKNDLGAFEQYINSFGQVSLANLSKDEQKAFWINTYNALTIYAVLKHISANRLLAKLFSVQMVSGFFDKITYVVAGENLTLNDIENQKLRAEFHDSRIHFAIVCASRSCPVIQNTEFRALDLDERLNEAARIFLQDDKRNRIDKNNNIVYLSEILRWYEDDFIKDSGSVIEYIKKHLAQTDAEYLSASDISKRYLYYNWLVNVKP